MPNKEILSFLTESYLNFASFHPVLVPEIHYMIKRSEYNAWVRVKLEAVLIPDFTLKGKVDVHTSVVFPGVLGESKFSSAVILIVPIANVRSIVNSVAFMGNNSN